MLPDLHRKIRWGSSEFTLHFLSELERALACSTRSELLAGSEYTPFGPARGVLRGLEFGGNGGPPGYLRNDSISIIIL
jgi:hypothetical protein